MFSVQWLDRLASEARQNGDAFSTARRTLVDGRLFICNGLCIGLAVWIAAPRALRLGQRIVDAVNQGAHF
jgi:hypothetical protein